MFILFFKSFCKSIKKYLSTSIYHSRRVKILLKGKGRPDGLLASRIYIDLFGKSKEEVKQALVSGVLTANRPRRRDIASDAVSLRHEKNRNHPRRHH
jgi:hypothetical protein